MTEIRTSHSGDGYQIPNYFRRSIPSHVLPVIEAAASESMKSPEAIQVLGIFQSFKTVQLDAIEVQMLLLDGNDDPKVQFLKNRRLVKARKLASDVSSQVQKILNLNEDLSTSFRHLEEVYEEVYRSGSKGMPEDLTRVEFMRAIVNGFGMHLFDA